MKIKNYNDQWKFWNEKNAFALVWDIAKDAEDVCLPHDAMIGQKADAQSPNGAHGAYRDGGAYVYVKNMIVPLEAKNQTLIMKFEGVHMNAFVYVNEQLAAKCPNGYGTFYVELNDYLRYGESNEIRVLVKNGAMANSRWYTGGGIYRDVYLLESGMTYMVPDGVKIKTDYIESDYAVQTVSAEIRNRRHLRQAVSVEVTIKEMDGNEVTKDATTLVVLGNETQTYMQRLVVKKPSLWSHTTPSLYTATLAMKHDGEVLDEITHTFGIREVQVDALRGLRINGEMVKLRGACVHHDSGIIGAATYDDAEYRRVRILKEAGFNAIRMAHNTIAPSLLRACDALGMYVMDETFDMWTRSKTDHDYGLFFDEWWERDVASMVRKNYNHPSVIMYSIGNEIPEIGTDHGSNLSKKIADKIKSLDDSRYTLASINGVFAAGDSIDLIVKDVVADLKNQGVIEGNVNHFMALMKDHMDLIVKHPEITKRLDKACASTDIAGYNYMTSRYEGDGRDYPNRVIVGSETYPPKIATNWEAVERLDHVIGDFTWTGWDYLGEAGVGIPAYAFGEGGFTATYPCQIAYCGDIDITGYRRPASYFREIVFGLRKEPYIAVQNPNRYGQEMMSTPWIISDSIASWTWEQCEGKSVVVEVYTPGDEVVLLCNGEVIEKKAAGPSLGYRVLFETVYTPGELVAIAYEKGNEIGRKRLKTAGSKRELRASIEYGKENELVYLAVELVDELGTLCTDAEDVLEIEVSGSRSLIGFGTANPKQLEAYSEKETHLYQGRAQAILRTMNSDTGNPNTKIILNYGKSLTSVITLDK